MLVVSPAKVTEGVLTIVSVSVAGVLKAPVPPLTDPALAITVPKVLSPALLHVHVIPVTAVLFTIIDSTVAPLVVAITVGIAYMPVIVPVNPVGIDATALCAPLVPRFTIGTENTICPDLAVAPCAVLAVSATSMILSAVVLAASHAIATITSVATVPSSNLPGVVVDTLSGDPATTVPAA